VVVTDGVASINSSNATLVVKISPVILQQPQSQTVAVGDNANLIVVAAGNPLPFGYRWRRGGSTFTNFLLNSSTHVLTLNNVTNGNAGTWTVVITNLANPSPGLLSSNAFLTVVTPPTNQVVSPGSSAAFNVSATGVATNFFRYQWQFNGTDLTDATNSTLTVDNVQAATQGTYAVVVNVATNPAPAPATFAATLSLLGAPQITTQPASQAVPVGTNVTFTVIAIGDAPLSYQWKFNGGVLSGKTASTLTLNNVQAASEGNYTVLVSNGIGTVASHSAVLTVLAPPVLSLPEVLPNGNFRARLQGTANRTYAIESSSDLKDWSALFSLVYSNGQMPFVDITATNAANRFYRARAVAP
jgi:hypothetical protein